jgi:hypothetical protein
MILLKFELPSKVTSRDVYNLLMLFHIISPNKGTDAAVLMTNAVQLVIMYQCSEAGELYSKKLANFIEKRLKSEKTASVRSHFFVEIFELDFN